MRQLQDQYLLRMGLEGLKRISSDKLNCRCPICGDSSKDKRKKRGYVLWNRRYNTYVFFCHKCGVNTNFIGLLKELDPLLYDNYSQEAKKELVSNFIKCNTSNTQKKLDLSEYSSGDITLDFLPEESIPCKENQACLEYLKKRHIPQKFINKWYFHNDFGLIVPLEYEDNLVYGWQGRNLEKKEFFTDLPEDNPKVWNLYSVNKENPCFVTESIIDATMLYHIDYQSIAALGSDINPKYLEDFNDLIFIFDNDEVGKKKTIKYTKLFPRARFLFWDKRIKYKDLNEIIVSGVELSKFKKFIDTSIKSSYEISILYKMNLL